jgi:hypothetical protein
VADEKVRGHRQISVIRQTYRPALALLGGERGGEIPSAAEEPGQRDRVHVVVIADDLAVSDPDDAKGGERVRPAGDGGLAVVGDLRDHHVRVAGLPDLRIDPSPLQHELHAALDVLLRRAQQAGAVRADITTPDLITLLKGLLRSISELPPGTADQALTDRLLTVITDGLRPRP